MKEVDVSSLEHTRWRCQYHVVFAPKYRRMEIYGKIKEDIGIILRKLCQQKSVEIIEAQACPDHIHMLISIEYISCEPSDSLKELFSEGYNADDDSFEEAKPEQA